MNDPTSVVRLIHASDSPAASTAAGESFASDLDLMSDRELALAVLDRLDRLGRLVETVGVVVADNAERVEMIVDVLDAAGDLFKPIRKALDRAQAHRSATRTTG